MKTIKLIFKGILFYTTIIIISLFISGIDSIYDNGYFLYAIGIITLLIYVCYKVITKEELNILLGSKLFGGMTNDEL